MRPSIGWYFFNLFRLVAVVFMIWVLAAQFVALASDLGELSKVKASPSASSPSTASASISAPTRSPIRSIPTSSATQPTGLITNSLPPLASRSNAVTVAQLGPEAITTTPPLVRPTSTAAAAMVDEPLVVARPGERSLVKRADEEEKPTSGVYGLSSVPTSAGGPMFSSVSRMIMATALGFLLLVQVGMPEMWLYRNVPAFGPQSTPSWLGVAQVIIAVEGLRVYSVPLVWVAHAGLLVIGMINSHLALILIVIARRRKLPNSPPPPLYFSRTTRLLFFRPLPECYFQLLSKEEQAQLGAVHSESYAQDPEDGVVLDSGPWRMKNRHVPPPPPKDEGMTDIRQGGYPTFARGGLTATGTQIPTSTLDITPDGRMRGLIARPVGDRRSLETTGDAYSGVADSSRAPSRTDTMDERKGSKSSVGSGKSKRKPPPLGLSPVGDHSHPERRQFERQRSITALREKIHKRMERKTDKEAEGGVPKEIPTITTTLPSAAPSALHTGPTRSSTVDTANTFGRQPTILRSIPKRGNTISQSIAPTRPYLPERASSQSQAGIGCPVVSGPVSKSPTGKSIAESTASSSLPWSKPSASAGSSDTSTEPVAMVNSVHIDQPSRRRTATLPPLKPNSIVHGQLKEDVSPAPRELRHVGRTSLQIPAGATVTRRPSGSKLQKARKADTKPSSPRSTSPVLPDTKVKANERAGLDVITKPSRNTAARGGTKPEATSDDRPSTLKKRSSPSPIPISPSPSSPVSPPRPQSADSTLVIQSSLRSSLAPLNRQVSVRSTRSARTAMGVRFDLEKRYSTSSFETETETDYAERESLLSPETNRSGVSTPRSAGFRIPGTKLFVPFPGTPRTKSKGNRPISDTTSASSPSSEGYGNRRSGLELEMGDSEDEIEAARPESFASQSTINSMREKTIQSDRRENEKKTVVGERAGLPKRAASIAIETKAVRRKEDPVLGGQYIDGGHEGNWKKGHARRPSSISIDSRQSAYR